MEVIVNGDAPVVASASAEGPISPKTAEQKLARKNELKAKSTLLLAIPNEYLLKSEGLDKIYDRCQKLISQLEIHGEVISQEDANLKLLRSLPSTWNNIALIMRNKADLDGLSMDDLYNNLKVYEAKIKSQSSLSSNYKNVAFVSSDDTSSTNEAVNTAHDVPAARAPRNQGNRNGDALRRIVLVETPTNALVVQDGIGGYDWSFQAEEGPIDFALMAHLSAGSSSSSSSDSEVRDNSTTELKNQLVEALKEKDDLKLKLEKFETLSKKLTKLINSQISVNNKYGIGFDSQMNENELHDCHLNKSEVFESASDSIVNEIEEENNQVNDRFKKVEGYHAVPPPYTVNYMPSRPDLSFAGLDNSVYKTNVSETISSIPRFESTAFKSSKDSLEQPKDVRPSAPIIKEWESNSDDDCVIKPSIEQNKTSYAKINFVKSDENTRKSVIKQHTYRQAKNLRKSQSPRVDKRNWNGIMTQKLGNGFEFNKKACFVCGSLNHLIKDCNFYENKIVEKSVLNNMRRITALTKSGNVAVNTAKQSSPRASVSNSTARYVNTATSRPTVNGAKPSSNVFNMSHSSVKRTFYQRTPANNNDFKEKVKTAKVNNVTTAGTKAVVSVVQGHEANAVKSSACWIWRPTGNVIDHISKDSRSYMHKRFDYGNPQYALQDQGIFDSRCSRNMTRNKFYLSDYQDIDGGFVAFRGSSKGGKITGKVLLKIPRQNNMYNFDLQNAIPLGGLTCLFAKAIIDESNLWHKRLGHINFKTMNKLVRGNLVRGLPSKIFENDHTCVTCQKGKQHKASFKIKLVSSISQPLQMLHMDLFGSTFVKSLNKKMYCLVVTDDFSRVKIIKCDNGTEFKNSEMNQFCEMKGIKREFSVARTPQQNRNRVLITKPHSKTSYELLVGRSPNLDHLTPFGCPVTILNTLDHLGKFEEKADEGFLVGYSVNSRAFRVFNSRTRKVEENLHIKFLENKSNIAGSGPKWLFDIDSLTKSMSYELVTAGNQTNDDAGIETNINAGQTGQEKACDHEYILLPRATALGYYQKSNANPSYQDRRQSMEDTLSKFMSESSKRHKENSNLIKEIRATINAAIRNQGASIKTLEIQIGQMSKVLQERGFGSLLSST
ncbi:ribonuclease H-like domain-containing protein [Tanacetum coccineum]